MLTSLEESNAAAAVERLKATEERERNAFRSASADRLGAARRRIEEHLVMDAKQKYAMHQQTIKIQGRMRRRALAAGRKEHAARCDKIIARAFAEIDKLLASGRLRIRRPASKTGSPAAAAPARPAAAAAPKAGEPEPYATITNRITGEQTVCRTQEEMHAHLVGLLQQDVPPTFGGPMPAAVPSPSPLSVLRVFPQLCA